LCFLSEFLELIVGLRNDYPPAGDNDGLFGLVDEPGRLLDLSRVTARDNLIA
jgi:hypothetical protein